MRLIDADESFICVGDKNKAIQDVMDMPSVMQNAKHITYRDAVDNALQGKCIPYRKVTLIKLYELLELLEQTEWIPVTERLPEDGTYLVTVERIVRGQRIHIRSFAKDLNKVDDFDFPEHKCGWYDYDNEYGYWEETRVIAWMPLPEPYKAGE